MRNHFLLLHTGSPEGREDDGKGKAKDKERQIQQLADSHNMLENRVKGGGERENKKKAMVYCRQSCMGYAEVIWLITLIA